MLTVKISEIKLTDNEIQAAVDVLRSGSLRQGKQCDEFEREFAQKTGAAHAVCSSNGSAALHLAYMTFLEPQDEVIVPSFTFIATASMVSMAGGRPVFCDVDPATFLIDLDHAESLVTARTRAISPVHLFGNPCNIRAVMAFAEKHNLKIVWDAAQAHGATFMGADIGSFGDFVAYSFYPSKNMFVGEGGITCVNNADFDYKMRFLRSHGQTGKYYHTMLGLNYRMTDVEAAIGRQQLIRLDDMLSVRRRNAAILNDGLSEVEGIIPQKVTDGGVSAWHQYSVVVNPDVFGFDRDELAARLAELGIATGVHYPRGAHQQPIFEKLYGAIELPVTEELTSRILALPVHHGLSSDDVLRVVDAVLACKS
ncbi:DegT/DnrJ/EryC1/StrS family aminotransferase [Thiovibrio sp. JS02]